MITTLNKLDKGKSGAIYNLNVRGDLRRRLLDIGLTPGTRVECLFKSSVGDPVAFGIRGAVIALRNNDTTFIDIYTEQ